MLSREKDKLEKTLGGIREMQKVPSAVWIVDTKKEHIAVGEARKLNIPVVAILDTNCDPDEVDYKIPGNDDAIRSVTLLTRVIADAVAEGLIARSGAAAGDEAGRRRPPTSRSPSGSASSSRARRRPTRPRPAGRGRRGRGRRGRPPREAADRGRGGRGRRPRLRPPRRRAADRGRRRAAPERRRRPDAAAAGRSPDGGGQRARAAATTEPSTDERDCETHGELHRR